jgi:hypothetical protein
MKAPAFAYAIYCIDSPVYKYAKLRIAKPLHFIRQLTKTSSACHKCNANNCGLKFSHEFLWCTSASVQVAFYRRRRAGPPHTVITWGMRQLAGGVNFFVFRKDKLASQKATYYGIFILVGTILLGSRYACSKAPPKRYKPLTRLNGRNYTY